MKIVCASYNVFRKGTESNFEPSPYMVYSNRVKNVIARIEDMIYMDAIIGLQEVTQDFLLQLERLFSKTNYKYVCCDNNNSGVCLAFNQMLYEVKSTSVYCPKNDKNIPEVQRKTKRFKNNHKLLCVKLIHKATQKEFVACVYHLPFNMKEKNCEQIITYILKYIENVKGDLPCVFLVDLNSTPGSLAYKHVVKTLVDTKSLSSFSITLPTTYTRNKQGIEFKGCIDYIFATKDVLVEEFWQNKTNTVLPSLSEGSDHLAIIAEIVLN